MLRQLFAALLIALAVSPFTAPFSTCDLAVVNPFHQDSDVLSGAKVVQDVSVIPRFRASGILLETAEPFNLPSSVPSVLIGEARTLVLRL